MKTLLSVGLAAVALAATPAQAADVSFVGNLSAPNQVLFFDFTITTASTVTLRSYSYAGGTNAQGTVIARGGFDPILGVYDSLGNRIGENDDGGCTNVPADSATGSCYDTFFRSALTAGTYRAAVSVFPNFGPTNLNTGTFAGATTFGTNRTSAFAFDVLNVANATGPGSGAVPEPATWAMLMLGFGAMGFSLRRKQKVGARIRFA